MELKLNIQKEDKLFIKFEILCLILLAADLFLNVVPLPIYLLILALYVYKSSRVELSFILIFFPGMMIIDVIYRGGYDVLLLLLFTGIVLILKDLRKYQFEISDSLFPLLIVFAGFLCTYLYSPKGYYSNTKIILIILNGFAYFLFFIAYVKSDKFNNFQFSLFLNFIFIFLAKLGIQRNIIHSPGSFLDFGFIRYGLDALASDGSTISFTGYHQFGALALFSLIFLLASTRKLNFLHSIVVIFCLYLCLLSGARQMIYGIVAVFIIYLISNMKSVLSGQVMFYIILFLSLVTIINSTDIPFFSDLLVNKDVVETAGGRKEGYETAIKMFKEMPLLGNGVGGFVPGGEARGYPHNIILEIMAEGGLFMFIIIFFSFYLARKRSSYKWMNLTVNGSLYVLLIVGFAVRAFSSSDLIENIALISALLAVSAFESKQSNVTSNISICIPISKG